MSSQSQENTNQTTKVSIFHVITAIVFCCLKTQTLVHWRHASPRRRSVTWPSFTAEWQKCRGLYGIWWATTWRAGQTSQQMVIQKNRTKTEWTVLADYKALLAPWKQLFTFCYISDQILSRHKMNFSHAQVKLTPDNRLIPIHISFRYISENFTVKRCLLVWLCSLCCFKISLRDK